MSARSTFVVAWAALALQFVATAAAQDDKWRKLPPLPGRAGGGAAVALEGETLWVKAGVTIAYWDGSTWQLPAGEVLKSGTYLAQFYGGGDRPLFFSQAIEREKTGKLYQLTAEGPKFQTEFQFDVPHEFPKLHVAKSGQIVNLTKAMLSVYSGEVWNKTPVPQVQGLVFETDERIYVFYPLAQRLFHIDRDNVIREKILSLGTAKDT